MVKSVKKYILVSCIFVALPFFFTTFSASADDSVRYAVTVNPSLTISIPSNLLELNLNPHSNPFDSEDLNVTVVTNNIAGYKLTMSSSSTNLTELTDNTKTIPTLPANAGGYTDETFVANRWGYKVGTSSATNYIPFVSGATIKETNTYAVGDVTTIRFASKVDYSQPFGSYKNTLTLTATANIVCDATISGYMQDFYPCADIATGTTGTLTDKRDNQPYTVKKFEDGRFWMVDNLNLGDTSNYPLTVTRLNSSNTNFTGSHSSDYIEASDFSGAYNDGGWKSTSGHFTYVRPEYITRTGTDSTSKTAYGTLYNYCAISAGTYCMSSSTTEDGDSTSDICPAGWRLPISGTAGQSEYTSLYNAGYNTVGKLHQSLENSGAAFNYAGFFSNSAIVTNRNCGYWPSSTRSSTTAMYRFYVCAAASDGNPAIGLNNNMGTRSSGISVRCILDSNE